MTKWSCLLIALSPLLPFTIHGQPADSIQAENLLAEAVKTLKKGDGEQSIALHNQALQYFEKNGNWLPWMKSHVKMGFVWVYDIGQPFVGLDLMEKAIRMPPRPPQTREEWKQLAWMHLNKGYVFEDEIADFISAKKEYEATYQIYIHQLGDDDQEIAEFLFHHYGNLCSRLSDIARARMLLQRTVQCSKDYDMPGMALYGDLAITYADEGDNQGVLKIVEEANSRKGLKIESLIILRCQEAYAQLNLGDIAAARKAAEQVPEMTRRAKQADPDEVDEDYYLAEYYQCLAAIENKLGNNQLATAHYEQALTHETRTWGTPLRREIAKLHGALGRLYLGQKQYRSALASFQLTLECVLRKFRPKSDEDNPTQDMLTEEENAVIEGLEGKAQAFIGLGQFEKALECYELIPGVEAKIRFHHAFESSKLLALDESRKRFDDAISIAWRLFEGSGGRRTYADRAFRLTEQARGMLLMESLAAAQAAYGLPAHLLQNEYDLQTKIIWYQQQIDEETDSQRKQQFEKVLFNLKQESERMRNDLLAQHPDYAALSRQIHFLESNELPSVLNPNQLMVDFYLTEKDLYVFSGNPKGQFEWRRTSLPVNFHQVMIRFIQYLHQGNEDDPSADAEFRATAHSFYQLFLAPEIDRRLPNGGSLLIIPDDALAFLPMEVLLRREAPSGNWPELPWLLNDYSTGYAYSASLLQMQLAISRQHRERLETLPFSFGGFAPVYSDGKNYTLTSTQPLVKDAQHLLGGRTWRGAECNEAVFKQYGPQCRVLLLAMHGKADDKNTGRSCLLFGDPGPDTLLDNNILYSNELQIMHLQADLAVLSACESGFGKLEKGEGVYSLARAFAQAGVPATVMSLWLLHENAAQPLVHAFLKHLQSGMTKDEALRQAKLEFLHNKRNFVLSHPFYWAGVNANGDMCELQLESNFPWEWAAAVLLLLLGGFWLWRRRRRRKNEQ